MGLLEWLINNGPRIVIGIAFLAAMISTWVGYTSEDFKIPRDQQKDKLPEYAVNFFTFFGLPEDWLYMPAFFYYTIIPLIGVSLIFYGFLEELNIFTSESRNAALSILVAISTIPTGVFIPLVAGMFSILGVYSTFAFFFLALMGVTSLTLSKMNLFGSQMQNSIIAGERRKLKGSIHEKDKEMAEYQKEMRQWRGMWDSGEVTAATAQEQIKSLGQKYKRAHQEKKAMQKERNDL